MEQLYGRTIAVPDRAFDRLFDFFDNYQWHLDDRPLRDDREINPDVLGYIFEQYINQKQMGAYYTKEDITDYIGKNTIIPFLFDQVQKAYPDGFRGAHSVWTLLQQNPDRYIYPAVGKGAHLPLPAEIAAGVDNVSQRGEWNTPATTEYALPTEIWRESVARHQRYAEVKRKLAGGEVQSINDLITLNLDMRQFAQDVIEQTDRPELVRAFWAALIALSVLDPTCGSGAFLFAALNILEPLYEACLARMQGFVEESGPEESTRHFKDFRTELEKMARHPNQKYFIYKSIVVNNLYGVDIMAEATEIAKLRLFLKLVAQVDDVTKLEPLPDIDFNIRAGNTLVGFATYADVEATVRGDRLILLPEDEEMLAEIKEEAEAVERLFGRFRKMQTSHDVSEWGEEFAPAKGVLTQRLKALGERLNRLLAQQYGVDPDKLEYDAWRSSHQPFHWFVEFYGILKAGGFDVIIGNPPYVEYRIVRRDYLLRNESYRSIESANLYAFCMERSTELIRDRGRFGMIVPTSVIGLDKTSSLRHALLENFGLNICSTYGIRPSKLFDGVDQRLCIYLAESGRSKHPLIKTTRHHYWYAEERTGLFGLIEYNDAFNHKRLSRFPQISNSCAATIFQKLETLNYRTVGHCLSPNRTGHLIHYHRSPRYWIRSIDFEPHFRSATRSRSVHHFRDLLFVDEIESKAVGALLNSSLFYWVYSKLVRLHQAACF